MEKQAQLKAVNLHVASPVNHQRQAHDQRVPAVPGNLSRASESGDEKKPYA